MLRIRMFKLPKAKQYNYIPVYYNEQKEKQETAQQENSTSYEQRIKGSFRHKKKLRNQTEVVKSNIRLLIIIIALTALALYFLYF
ncbi:MAG: hypothetical protein N2449_09145 [Bacteroidales bacterium]|nr:hypothetical protein [Bacteroidales bacterium]